MTHITVLKNEAVDILSIQSNSKVIDATLGASGHAKAICELLGKEGVFIGIDADQTAIDNSELSKLESGPKIHLVNDNFTNIDQILSTLNIKEVDAILADLGWRSEQFSEGKKGFSFGSDDPLLMTYGDPQDYLFTADDLVNGWKEEDIANVLYGYGEERASRRIAKAIVKERAKRPIKTASQLAKIIEGAIPKINRKSKVHPATKSFQAIRIAVNDEFNKLETFIDKAVDHLSPNGVMAIISFHSLEDRIVKLKFRELANTDEFELLTKKPITATDQELQDNQRARSAKLRALKKVDNTNFNNDKDTSYK